MKGWISTLLAGLLVVAAVPIFAQGNNPAGQDAHHEFSEPAAATPFPGGSAPDFALTDYQGQVHKLSDLRGKPVLINFWASWCTPCREEMPELARASKTLGKQVQFLGVNLAANDSNAVSKALLQKYSVSYPNVLDQKGNVADAYRVMVIPTTFLLDSNGKIVHRFQGPVNGAQIAQWLRKVS